MKIAKKIVLTLLFPALMFVVMLVLTAVYARNTGRPDIFLSSDLIRYVIMNSCMSVCVALAIWLQLKNGRFDFSNGASMILTAIIAGDIGNRAGSPIVVFLVAIVCGVVLCSFTAFVYTFGRLQTVIATIGVTLLYESLTYLVAGGNGVTIYFDNNMSIFGRVPLVFIPAGLAILVFLVYDNMTSAGRKGKILAKNQSAGVNIGIKERKNVFTTYIVAGIIIGFAATTYVSQNAVAVQSGLSTSGIMFSYIVPVYMGTFIGRATKDVIGISAAAVGLSIMNYGLNCMNLGAGGWQQIIFGVFVMCFYTMSAQSDKIMAFFNKRKAVEGAVQ